MIANKSRLDRLGLAVIYTMTAALMFTLKHYYSSASADQLLWILKPVAWIVSAVETLPYAWASGVGYIRADQGITIAPACAGVNFMIMAFGLPVAAFAHRQKTFSGRLLIWLCALWSAYAMAVLVNSLRIIAAIAFYDAHVGWGWFTPDRLHRMVGVAVYFSALGLYYALWHRIITGSEIPGKAAQKRWLPWIWYIIGAVAVPVANQLYRGKAWPGLEHCLTVIILSGLIWGSAKACMSLAQTAHRKSHEPRTSPERKDAIPGKETSLCPL